MENITRFLLALILFVSIFPLLHVTLFQIHTLRLLPEWNTLHDKPTQQNATAANTTANHCKQFRISSNPTHMYVPQDYFIVNGITMTTAWITVILLHPAKRLCRLGGMNRSRCSYSDAGVIKIVTPIT
jgi:hypothetical protein